MIDLFFNNIFLKSSMAIEPISFILIIVTMVSTISHLILDMLKQRNDKKIDKTKLELEQGKAGRDKTKLELEQSKAGMDMLSNVFPIKEYMNLMLSDPEAFKEKIKELQESTDKLKDIFKKPEED